MPAVVGTVAHDARHVAAHHEIVHIGRNAVGAVQAQQARRQRACRGFIVAPHDRAGRVAAAQADASHIAALVECRGHAAHIERQRLQCLHRGGRGRIPEHPHGHRIAVQAAAHHLAAVGDGRRVAIAPRRQAHKVCRTARRQRHEACGRAVALCTGAHDVAAVVDVQAHALRTCRRAHVLHGQGLRGRQCQQRKARNGKIQMLWLKAHEGFS